MYLSKIEIIGFKSFAQRVNLNFDTGVTAIVGPNGCGKTNIVDAIRWALGEQRYSTLRSDKMEDVIFNGTKNRKPLGMSEVSLTIENSKGILPTEYSEVTITRRVFRSGESEYLLNKVPCRLKDILDLFMDTGMGSDAYSVIELKMVETILSDKADERRKLFEEAAGVTKYKSRRKAAIRKLEAVQQDLTRVNDIVKEVQKTVNSLERQAKKAEQYNEVSTRLRSLEIDLHEREYAHLNSKLVPLQSKFTLAQTDKTTIDEALRAQEAQVDHLRSNLGIIENELRESQRAAAEQSENMHRLDEKILVANERLKSLTANIDRFEQEKIDLRSQDATLRSEQVALVEQRLRLVEELAKASASYAAARSEQEESDRDVESKRTAQQLVNDAVLRLAHEIVQKRGEHDRLKSRIENLKGRIERSREDNAFYESEIAKLEQLVTELSLQDRDLRRRFAEAEIQLFEREGTKQTVHKAIEETQERILQAKHAIERTESQIDFLKRMVEDFEGFSEGAKYLLSQSEWKKKRLVTVADVVQVKEKYRVAVEAMLADIAQFLVVERIEDGYLAVEDLKRQGKGRATFLCLEWIPRIVHRRRAKQPNDAFIRASEVVECEPRYRSLVDFLIGEVVIVEDTRHIDSVLAHNAGIRCVSLDGQVVTSIGMLRGGGARVHEGGFIGKKAHITELEQHRATLTEQLQSLQHEHARQTAEYEAIDLQPIADSAKGIEKEMTAIEMRIAQLEFEKKRARDSIERNASDIGAIEMEIEQHQAQFESTGTALAQLEAQKIQQETLATEATKHLELAEIRWNDISKTVSELEIRVVTLQGDLRNCERDIDRMNARVTDIGITLTRRDEEILRAQEEIVYLTTDSTTLQEQLTQLRTEYQILEAHKGEIERNYREKRNELHQIELRIKDERRLHEDSVTAVHELEMKIAEINSNIENLKQRMRDEFEMELVLKTYPQDEWVDFAQLREEVKNLKERIRILGAINFAAFDEFTTESERLTFLTQQRDDLIEAERTLLATIDEINATAQRMFSETFERIRTNFITIFKELFHEGDECDLRIEEGVDPLEANIEIIAKPRGKRPTSIDLLSGGEKTLTAIALLFAIYLVKPSPFCILDEVDAPLDDSNIDRYTRILQKFSDNTQFIVVTHNKRTMEAAKALYGVTMEEEGVSKLVTVRFNEESRVRSATVSN
jgi:chromosome segregation protein